jgi:2',3'-cyclic-nucleotide 2'-phosphodiesterase (5'-nucleotidase family)
VLSPALGRLARLGALVAIVAIDGAACKPSSTSDGGVPSAQIAPTAPTAARAPRGPSKPITILATADVSADTEPCGCKVRQLGGIARRAKVVADRARSAAGRTLVVDGGDLFFKTPMLSPRDTAQAREGARFLAESLRLMDTPVMAVGERDLALGLDTLRALSKVSGTTMLAANLVFAKTGTAAFEPFRIVERNGVKIGVVGAALELEPDAPAYHVYATSGLKLVPTEAALTEAAKAARAAGAELVVGLLHLGVARTRDVIGKLEPGLVDVAIAAHDRHASESPEPVGASMIGYAGERGKWLLALDLQVSPGARGVVDLGAVESSRRTIAELDERITTYERADAGVADPALGDKVAADRRATVERLKKRRAAVEVDLARVSVDGKHTITSELLNLDVALPEEPTMLAAFVAYKERLREVNAATGITSGPEVHGTLKYAGNRACRSCHEDALAHWKTTGHAKAWATMVRTRQTGNLDCIGCHTTGFDRPGGPSGLAGLEAFHDVGCESCHGPSSAHVEKPELKTPYELTSAGAVCAECHRAQADQKPFVLEERLPKILGPGHGAPMPGAKPKKK